MICIVLKVQNYCRRQRIKKKSILKVIPSKYTASTSLLWKHFDYISKADCRLDTAAGIQMIHVTKNSLCDSYAPISSAQTKSGLCEILQKGTAHYFHLFVCMNMIMTSFVSFSPLCNLSAGEHVLSGWHRGWKVLRAEKHHWQSQRPEQSRSVYRYMPRLRCRYLDTVRVKHCPVKFKY